MNDLAEKIQVVMNTIQDLDIKPTFDNMNHLMGVLQALASIRDELKDVPVLEVSEDGNADTE